jgi:hypothetical protein
MRPRSAAIIACRVISIWLAVQTFTQMVAFLIFTRGGIEGSGEFWAITGTTAIIAWALWIFAESAAASMTRGAPDEMAPSARPTVNVHAVAISVVGIVVAVTAIPGLVALAASTTSTGGSFTEILTPGGAFGYGDRGAALAAEVMRLMIGLVLVGTSGDIARSLARKYPEPEAPAGGPTPGSP